MQKMKWSDAQKELNSGKVFLEFYTSWCPDCKMMEPVIAEVEKIITDKNIAVKFIAVDAEEANLFQNPQSNFSVLKVPSFFIINKNKPKHIGYEYLPIELLVSSIESD